MSCEGCAAGADACASVSLEATPNDLPSRLGLPEITENNLRDLCKCLELGDIVVLLTGNKRFMMPYCKPGVPSQDPNTFRVIYMDIGKMESLGLDGEWPWYFESSAGAVKYQQGDLIPRILACDLPHTFHFGLGFSAS